MNDDGDEKYIKSFFFSFSSSATLCYNIHPSTVILFRKHFDTKNVVDIEKLQKIFSIFSRYAFTHCQHYKPILYYIHI